MYNRDNYESLRINVKYFFDREGIVLKIFTIKGYVVEIKLNCFSGSDWFRY